MYEQYGEFAKIVSALDEAQSQARTVWTDRTAASYDPLNNNIKVCAGRIWAPYTDSVAGTNAVKANYNADEIDRSLAILEREVEEV